VFSEEEHRRSNCSGKRGKEKLDPRRLNVVGKLTYCHFPLKQGEDENKDWQTQCVKAIDELNRRKMLE